MLGSMINNSVSFMRAFCDFLTSDVGLIFCGLFFLVAICINVKSLIS